MRCGLVLGLLGVLACGRTGGSSAPSATSSTTAASTAASLAPAPSVTQVVAIANDGTDAKRPILSPDDTTFTDGRHGWGWSDRCLNEGRAKEYGWAMAACEKGLGLPDLDATAKPALLYNEGLVAEESGDRPWASVLYERALALRGPDDPYRQTVMQAVSRVGGNPCAAGEQPGVCFGMTSSLCCYKKCKKDSDCPKGNACGNFMCVPAPP